MNTYDPEDISHLIQRLKTLGANLPSDIERATIALAADALDYLQDQINQYSNY